MHYKYIFVVHYSKNLSFATLLHTVLTRLALTLWQLCVFTSSGAKVREVSLHVSHSTATQLITELDYLRGNHSKAVEAEEEAKNALDISRKKHAQLKVEIELQKATNDNHWRQIGVLQVEKTRLQSNISALGETELYYSFYLISELRILRNTWSDKESFISARGDLWQMPAHMDSSQLILLFLLLHWVH